MLFKRTRKSLWGRAGTLPWLGGDPWLPPTGYGPLPIYPPPPPPGGDPDFVRLKEAASCVVCSELFSASPEAVEKHESTHTPRELWMRDLVQWWNILEKLEESIQIFRNHLKRATARALGPNVATGSRRRRTEGG